LDGADLSRGSGSLLRALQNYAETETLALHLRPWQA